MEDLLTQAINWNNIEDILETHRNIAEKTDFLLNQLAESNIQFSVSFSMFECDAEGRYNSQCRTDHWLAVCNAIPWSPDKNRISVESNVVRRYIPVCIEQIIDWLFICPLPGSPNENWIIVKSYVVGRYASLHWTDRWWDCSLSFTWVTWWKLNHCELNPCPTD